MNPTEHQKFQLEILRKASSEGLPEQVGPDDTLEVVAVYAELLREGYLTGHLSLLENGVVGNVAGAKITLLGRQRIERLEKELDAKKPSAKAGQIFFLFLKYLILPIAIALAIAWLSQFFALK